MTLREKSFEVILCVLKKVKKTIENGKNISYNHHGRKVILKK